MSKRFILVLAAMAVFGAGSAFADNSLDVNGSAAIVGNYGLEVLVDGSGNPVYVAETDATNDETVYRAEFRIRHNDVAMDNGTGHAVLFGRRGGPVLNNLRVFLTRNSSGAYQIRFRAKNDGPGTRNCGKTTFGAGGGLRLGIEWVASEAGMGNGECRLFRNGIEVVERTNLVNETMEVDSVRFGAPEGVDATTIGSFYLDDFSSFRTLAP